MRKYLTFCILLFSLLILCACGGGNPTTIGSLPEVQAPSEYRSSGGEPVSCDTCCRKCVVGKACGDTCINANFQCHTPPGCACNQVESNICYRPTPPPSCDVELEPSEPIPPEFEDCVEPRLVDKDKKYEARILTPQITVNTDEFTVYFWDAGINPRTGSPIVDGDTVDITVQHENDSSSTFLKRLVLPSPLSSDAGKVIVPIKPGKNKLEIIAYSDGVVPVTTVRFGIDPSQVISGTSTRGFNLSPGGNVFPRVATVEINLDPDVSSEYIENIPASLVVNSYSFNIKYQDNGLLQDEDKIALKLEALSGPNNGLIQTEGDITLGEDYVASSLVNLDSYSNNLKINSLSGGKVKPSTLGFQIDNVELSPSSPGASSPASRGIFEGSKALEQNEDLTILVECRRPAASGNSDSAKLARAIELATNQRLPCGTEAHHIVAVNDARAEESRGILAKHGIDINSAENGVPLPADSSVTQVEGMPHASLHTIVYHLEVRNRLAEKDASGGKQGVLQELEEIRQQLLNRTFPIL